MKIIKSLLLAVLVLMLVLGMSVSVFAKGNIFVDLQEVATDTPSQIINDRTMVPVRAITEMLGYDVYWHGDTRQVDVCEKDSTDPVIIMQIDSTKAYYAKYNDKGDKIMVEASLDSPATIVNDRTLVPLRFISEAVGYDVEYIPETGDVYLFSPEYIENHKGEGKGEAPEGVNADGKGEVIPLSYEQMEYVLAQKTEDWLAMSEDEKAELVNLIARWWEDYENIVVEDFDDMVMVVDHQMEQYHKNGVNDYVFYTICEIYDVDVTVYATTD